MSNGMHVPRDGRCCDKMLISNEGDNGLALKHVRHLWYTDWFGSYTIRHLLRPLIFSNLAINMHIPIHFYLSLSARHPLNYANQLKFSRWFFDVCSIDAWVLIQIKFYLCSPKSLFTVDTFSAHPLPLEPQNSKTGKIRNLRKNHRGGILLPRTDRCAIDVICTEPKNMVITIPLECLKHPWVPESVDSLILIQTQVDSVGPGVNVLHVVRSECWVQEYVESVNPEILEV